MATPAGIYNDKLYCVSDSGVVCECSLDLSEHKEVMRLDMKMGWHAPAGITTDGMMYCYSESGTLYAVPLSDPDVRETVAENVLTYTCYDDDVYYTVYDHREYGKYGKALIYTDCGGTLWKYSGEEKRSETVFEDCGGDVGKIEYIDDKVIRWRGCYYAGMSNGHKYLDLANGRVFFEFSYDTGEARVVYEQSFE